MLFMHALLFLLCSTSGVALPIDELDHVDHDQHLHGQHPPYQVPYTAHSHRRSPPGHGQHPPSHDSDPRWQSEQGKELEPCSVPLSFYGALGIEPPDSPQQTLMLENIKNHLGVWYREPSNNAHYNNLNDVMEILEVEELARGIVLFHTLSPTAPGQVIWQYTLLTSQNRRRLVGVWSRMPALVSEDHYHDTMIVLEEGDRLHYYVDWFPLHMPLLVSQMSGSTYPVQPSVPPPECRGIWVRLPDENTPRDWANDVAEISAHFNRFWSLCLWPGHLCSQQSFQSERMEGNWYLMPFALTPLKNRLDKLHVKINTEGKLDYTILHRPVPMLHSMQHSHP